MIVFAVELRQVGLEALACLSTLSSHLLSMESLKAPVSNGTLSVGAPGKGNLRVYVLNGGGKIGADGPYLK